MYRQITINTKKVRKYLMLCRNKYVCTSSVVRTKLIIVTPTGPTIPRYQDRPESIHTTQPTRANRPRQPQFPVQKLNETKPDQMPIQNPHPSPYQLTNLINHDLYPSVCTFNHYLFLDLENVIVS